MGNHRHNPFARGNLVGQLPIRVMDAIGRDLAEGDMVIMPSIHSPMMRVADIRANLHPGAPPNTIQVTLALQIHLNVPSSTAINQIVLAVPNPELEQDVERQAEAQAASLEAKAAAGPAPVVVAEADGPRSRRQVAP